MRAEREDWFEAQDELDPDRLVFLDETATTTNMVRRYGWAPRGERCRVVQSRCVVVRLRPHGGTRYGTGSARQRHDD